MFIIVAYRITSIIILLFLCLYASYCFHASVRISKLTILLYHVSLSATWVSSHAI